LAVATLTLVLSPAHAADSPAGSANSTVPANPFGAKPVTPSAAVVSPPEPAPGPANFVATLRAMLLRRFDKIGTGILDAAELTEARKVLSGGQDTRLIMPAEATAASQGPLFGLRPLIMKRFDHRSEGQLDAAELAEINILLFGPANTPTNQADDLSALEKDILKHFDKKGDGQLDATERAAAKAWLEQVMADLDQAAKESPLPEMK
jgi:hypothetical protein